MAISLADIKQSIVGPPRVLIYGVPGIGKTTVASRFPKPIFVPIEEGLGKLDVAAFPRPKNYREVCECLGALLEQPHDYQTLVIDSADTLEPMLWDYVTETVPSEKGGKVGNIHGYGFHKGFDHAKKEWAAFLSLLTQVRDSGMAVCVLAHSTIAHVDSPEVDAYDRYQPSIEKKSEPLLRGWADMILFLNYKMVAVEANGRTDDRRRAVGKGERVAYTTERPAWYAKNRYGLPDKIEIPEGRPEVIWSEIDKAMTTPAMATEIATVS